MPPEDAAPIQTAAPVQSPAQPQIPAQAAAPARRKKRKRGNIVVIAAVIALALLVILFLILLFAGSGKKAKKAEIEEPAPAELEAPPLPEEPEPAEAPEIDDSDFNGEGAVQGFIGEPFYDGVINDEADALAAVNSVIKYVGGDDSTGFGGIVVQEIEDGSKYYSFQQMAGDVVVYGAAVKLLADKDGKAIGLTSSIVPGIRAESMDQWAVGAEDAEAAVMKEYDGEGLKLISGATEQAFLPFEDQSDRFYSVWVVYSNNVYNDVDTAYLAHYVDKEGNFLYSTPVSKPGSSEALSGGIAAFAFGAMQSSTWSGTVKNLAGEELEVEIPVMIDPDTGDQILGDAKRQILCADYSDYWKNGTITPCIAKDGKWDDEAVITYSNFIGVYDFYASAGWNGGDGAGSASLILVNGVNDDGTPMNNAVYAGKRDGFQVFAFDTKQPFGEAVDVMAHEYTHCFTATTMTANLYMNDYGAINEGMSDIMGNLTAMMTDETDEPFVIGEKLTNAEKRRMGDPNLEKQPAFVWDRYYVPAAQWSTDYNDNGGVHTNSSLLNIISYKLDQAGMKPEDQFYYWMNVSFAMTPRTDFSQLIEIMPWVMKNLGYTDHLQALQDAIDGIGLRERSLPAHPAEGLGIMTVEFPAGILPEDYAVIAEVVNVDTGDQTETYPEAGSGRIASAVPEGNYFLLILVINPETQETTYFLPHSTDLGGWERVEGKDLEKLTDSISSGQTDFLYPISSGEVIELDAESLAESLSGL